MSRRHLLLDKAFRYSPRAATEDLRDYKYDALVGAWTSSNTGEFLVLSKDPNWPPPGTKKMDQETGEDLKGS
jgi:hypothetical protein